MAEKQYVTPQGGFVTVTDTSNVVYLTPTGEFLVETQETSGHPPTKRYGGVPFARRVRWVW